MRIRNIIIGLCAAAGLGLGSVVAYDGPTPTNGVARATDIAINAGEAFRSGAQAWRAGERDKAMVSLQHAAKNGHALAQWKLGRIYADGDGVTQDDIRAFDYFSQVANSLAEDSHGAPEARIVANAFVALGQYYREGIPNSVVKPDPERAMQMLSFAASYFGDADAQYLLARLYLDGQGTAKDVRQGARWLGLAASKGQYQAQALLGAMLFSGEGVPRQAARGLMWLTLAKESANKSDSWIGELHANASSRATDAERARAVTYLERWIKGGRD